MSDLPPSDEELKQAQALAEALEAREPPANAPADALSVAALIRHSRGVALDSVGLARSRMRLTAVRSNWIPLVIAASLLLAIVGVGGGKLWLDKHPPRPWSLPVLRAQTAAIANHDPALLKRAMGGYRKDMLAELEHRYGDSP